MHRLHYPHRGQLEEEPPGEQGLALCVRAGRRVPSSAARSKHPPLCRPRPK